MKGCSWKSIATYNAKHFGACTDFNMVLLHHWKSLFHKSFSLRRKWHLLSLTSHSRICLGLKKHLPVRTGSVGWRKTHCTNGILRSVLCWARGWSQASFPTPLWAHFCRNLVHAQASPQLTPVIHPVYLTTSGCQLRHGKGPMLIPAAALTLCKHRTLKLWSVTRWFASGDSRSVTANIYQRTESVVDAPSEWEMVKGWFCGIWEGGK